MYIYLYEHIVTQFMRKRCVNFAVAIRLLPLYLLGSEVPRYNNCSFIIADIFFLYMRK